MSMDYRNSERRRFVNDLQAREKEIAAVLKVSSPSSPKSQQMNEKRVRREIANGNERRRMQTINAGFTSLRALIPHLEGEKLSKAAILQHSIDYISTLEKDKTRLQMQLERTTQLLTELGQQDRVLVDSFVSNTPPPSKRKKRDTESSDEGVGSLSDASDDCGADLRQKNEVLKHQMDRERQRGDSLDEENRSLRNLIFLMQKQNARDQQITLVTTAAPQETCGREVMEVVSPSINYTPPLHQDEMMEYSNAIRPSSLTPDNTITMANTVIPSHSVTSRILEPVTLVSNVTMELRDTPSVGIHNTPSPSLITMSSPNSIDISNSTGVETLSQSSTNSSYLHNYAHRDHPRRRRHQAQLERQRIEEEERLQKEEEERQLQQQQHLHQQQQSLTSIPNTYIPRPSVRSLDILAEAANHVKDDRISRLYEEKPLQSSHPILIHVSESSMDRLSGQIEIKCDNDERMSPSHSTAIYTSSHNILPQHNVSPYVPIIVTAATVTTENTNNNSTGSSFSEKYPIATHLLHRPLHAPFTRPGVIVQQKH